MLVPITSRFRSLLQILKFPQTDNNSKFVGFPWFYAVTMIGPSHHNYNFIMGEHLSQVILSGNLVI